MFDRYFTDDEVRIEYQREFISLWPGWLGKENYHHLEEVTEYDWAKFNSLIRIISKSYKVQVVDLKGRKIIDVNNIEQTFSTYEDSMKKASSDFSIYVIPELDFILSEDWDYTFIVWYKNKSVIDILKPFLEKCGLFHFS